MRERAPYRRSLLGLFVAIAVIIVGAQTGAFRTSAAGNAKPHGFTAQPNSGATLSRAPYSTATRATPVPPRLFAPPPETGTAAAAVPNNAQLLSDTGFEEGTGTTAWQQFSSAGFQLIDTFFPHTGSWDADLCGYSGCNDAVAQFFTVPTNINAATLTFWLAGFCNFPSGGSSCSGANNSVLVIVADNANNALGAQFTISAPANSITGYEQVSVDVGAFLAARPGQSLHVLAGSTTSNGDMGGFFVDDVTLTANDPPTSIVATSPAAGQVSASWSPPPDAATNGVSGYAVSLYNSTRTLVTSQNVAGTTANFTSLANGTPYFVGVTWFNDNGVPLPTQVNGATGYSYSVTPFSGTAAPTVNSAVSLHQYILPNSDGSTWQRMDESNLSISISPLATENVLLSANADLWTWNAGLNQDIGIMVTPGTGAPVLATWKESGGFAGTFSPNAAFVETVYPMSSGTTYRVDVVWKTNVPTIGGSVTAGAGPISTNFSPTTLNARVLPAGYQSGVSTTQYSLLNSDGSTWQPVDTTNLRFTFTPGASAAYVLSGNADMWTWNAGFNQDLGIDVSPACGGQTSTLAAWKESGGFAGTFSPNAAYVQTVCQMNSGTQYTVTLEWKTNRQAGGAKISIGAGPSGPFSPTSLTAWPLPTNMGAELSDTEASTQQYTLSNSDGSAWQEMDSTNLVSGGLSPSGAEMALVSANADLWTSQAGYNQDIAIFVSVDGGAQQLVGWKESGGFGGTFSPNAAFLQIAYPMSSSHTYVFSVWWKANKPASGATIWAGAGPIASAFSPTRMTVVPMS